MQEYLSHPLNILEILGATETMAPPNWASENLGSSLHFPQDCRPHSKGCSLVLHLFFRKKITVSSVHQPFVQILRFRGKSARLTDGNLVSISNFIITLLSDFGKITLSATRPSVKQRDWHQEPFPRSISKSMITILNSNDFSRQLPD